MVAGESADLIRRRFLCCQAAVSLIVKWYVAGSGSDLSEELVAGVEPAALDSESPPIVLPDPLLSPHAAAAESSERLLQEVHLELGLLLDKVITGGAIPPDLEGSAACRVPRCFSGKRVTAPPLREQAQRPRKFLTLCGQFISCARRPLGVGP